MNRTTLISIGIIVILLVAGAWVYLMLFGTPDSADDVYTNLGFAPVNQPVTIIPTETVSDTPATTLIDTGSQALSQLTTRPVAGFVATTSTSSSVVRYMERGTGHIYDIDLTSGEEGRVSPTTIPQVSEAVFNSDGTAIAITTFQNYSASLNLARLNETGLETSPISNNAENVTFIDDNTLAYTESVNGVTVGYHYDLATDTKTQVFQFAFAELDVWWGGALGSTYLLSKPAASLPTYSYKLVGSDLTAALPVRNGLSGFSEPDKHIVTYYTNSGYRSGLLTDDNTEATLPLLTLSQKCTFDTLNTDFIWCGAPITTDNKSYVDDWYKGVLVSDDYIWLVNLSTQSAELVANPRETAGRSIDITHMQSNKTGEDLFFLNRTDRTLWRYDLLAR